MPGAEGGGQENITGLSGMLGATVEVTAEAIISSLNVPGEFLLSCFSIFG